MPPGRPQYSLLEEGGGTRSDRLSCSPSMGVLLASRLHAGRDSETHATWPHVAPRGATWPAGGYYRCSIGVRLLAGRCPRNSWLWCGDVTTERRTVVFPGRQHWVPIYTGITSSNKCVIRRLFFENSLFGRGNGPNFDFVFFVTKNSNGLINWKFVSTNHETLRWSNIFILLSRLPYRYHMLEVCCIQGSSLFPINFENSIMGIKTEN